MSTKTSFFEIIKKNCFVHKSVNTSRKRMLFSDNLEKIGFCPYIRNYQYFEQTNVFLFTHSLAQFWALKSDCTRKPKIGTFQRIGQYFVIPWKNRFFEITGFISTLKTLFLWSLWKNCFLATTRHNNVILKALWKYCFVPIFPKTSTFPLLEIT